MLTAKTEEILTYIISKHKTFNAKGHPLYLSNVDFCIQKSELKEICSILLKEELLSKYDPKTLSVFISHKGLHYFELKKKEKSNLWLKSVWMPVIVTLLTNAIISLLKWLWPQIQQLLLRIL